METPASLEVVFCDLCNTSVPLQDVERGAAIRHQGKIIGACCLPLLRGGMDVRAFADGASAASPLPGSPVPLSSGPSSSGQASSGGETRVLPLGIVLLFAVASAALFLDYRIGQVQARFEGDYSNLAGSLKSQAEVVQGISLALDRVALRADIDRLDAQSSVLGENQQTAAQALKAIGDEVAAAKAAVQTLQQAVVRGETSRPDHGPALAEIHGKLQQHTAALAEILARPRQNVDAAVQPEVQKPAAPTDGLSPEIAHQVARLGDADDGARFEAVDELLRSKDARVLPHLLPMTKDADTFVRRLAVEGLKDFKTAEVVDALIIALADPEVIVRDSAWRSLKDLTGQSLPFEAAATSRDVRARAQQKWQEWWDKNRATFGS